MNILFGLTIFFLLLSFFKSKQKTIKALKIALKKLKKILPAFAFMLVLTSISLALLPEELITQVLDNDNKFLSVTLASLIGSTTMIPGFIAFPLCGVLLKKGVSYMVLSAFSTTLMMVGILTFPLEKAYFGVKVTLIRNFVGLVLALLVSIVIGFVYGEIII